LSVMKPDVEEKSTQLSSEHTFLRHRDLAIPDMKAQLIFWPIVAIGLTLDLWSKSVVFSWLEQKPGNSISIIGGFLQLVRTVNPGAAFGIAAGRSYLLMAVSVVALGVILIVFFVSGTQQRLVHIALAFFVAGICGNLYDRISNDGLVRDFIDVVYWPGKHWPAFNVADSLLCIGVGLMVISCVLTNKSPPERAQQHK
jgi:signal peptidase II